MALTLKCKQLEELTVENKLLRLSDNSVRTISEIFFCAEDSNKDQKKIYFYFKDMGSAVRDKVMKKMFKNNADGFILYN